MPPRPPPPPPLFFFDTLRSREAHQLMEMRSSDENDINQNICLCEGGRGEKLGRKVDEEEEWTTE